MLFTPTESVLHDYSITVTLYANTPYAELVWNINAKPAEPWPEDRVALADRGLLMLPIMTVHRAPGRPSARRRKGRGVR